MTSHWTFDDPYMSQKHLRVYVISSNVNDRQIQPLVYVEDLSRNGTHWNGSLMGRKTTSFLLCTGDRLRLTSRTSLIFQSSSAVEENDFDLTQEREMRTFREKYIVTDNMLGTGVFGRTYMAIEQTTRTQLACKVVDLRKLDSPDTTALLQGAVNERKPASKPIELLAVHRWANNQKRQVSMEKRLRSYFQQFQIVAACNHPNIIGIHKVFVTDHTMYIFQDLIAGCDLVSYMSSKNGRLLEVEAAIIVRQVIVAIQFLHERQIAHRDLNPKNVMITNSSTGSRVVLTGFGFARQILPLQRVNDLCGVTDHRISNTGDCWSNLSSAKAKRDSFAADICSIGNIAALLLIGYQPFDNGPGPHDLNGVTDTDMKRLEVSSRWQRLGEVPKDFIRSLLSPQGQNRPTSKQALRNPWLLNRTCEKDLEALYKQSAQPWRSLNPNLSLIEFVVGKCQRVKRLECSRKICEESLGTRPRYIRPQALPIDPPYKPFYKNLYEQVTLLDKREKRSYKQTTKDLTKVNQTWKENKILSASVDLELTSPSEQLDGNPLGILTALRCQNRVVRRQKQPAGSNDTYPSTAKQSMRPKILRMESFHSSNDSLAIAPRDVEMTHQNVLGSPETAFSVMGANQRNDVSEPNVAMTRNVDLEPFSGTVDPLTERTEYPPCTDLVHHQERWSLNVQSCSKLKSFSSVLRSRSRTPLKIACKPVSSFDGHKCDQDVQRSSVEKDERVDVSEDASITSAVLPHYAHLRISSESEEIC